MAHCCDQCGSRDALRPLCGYYGILLVLLQGSFPSPSRVPGYSHVLHHKILQYWLYLSCGTSLAAGQESFLQLSQAWLGHSRDKKPDWLELQQGTASQPLPEKVLALMAKVEGQKTVLQD